MVPNHFFASMSDIIISPNGYVMVTVVGGGTRFLNRQNIVSIHIEGTTNQGTGEVELDLIICMANMKADCTIALQDMREGTEIIKELTGIIPPQEEPRPVVPGFTGPR